MTTPASLKGHPVHTMLVPLPIGLWTFALVADVLARVTGGPEWQTVAFYSIGGGVVGALLAAIPGLIDLISLPPGPTRRTGIWHLCVNLAAVAVFAVNFLMRWGTLDHSGPLFLTVLGIVLISVSGWLGGELVYRGGVGVAPAAREGTPPR
jgi:uncharacterized membrane protein